LENLPEQDNQEDHQNDIQEYLKRGGVSFLLSASNLGGERQGLERFVYIRGRGQIYASLFAGAKFEPVFWVVGGIKMVENVRFLRRPGGPKFLIGVENMCRRTDAVISSPPIGVTPSPKTYEIRPSPLGHLAL